MCHRWLKQLLSLNQRRRVQRDPRLPAGPYLVSPSEGRMMTMNTRKKKHLCMVSWFSLDLGKGGKRELCTPQRQGSKQGERGLGWTEVFSRELPPAQGCHVPLSCAATGVLQNFSQTVRSQGWTSCPSEKGVRWWQCSCKRSAEQAQGFGLAEGQDREQIVGTGQCFLCYETLSILNLHAHHGELGCASQVRTRALLLPAYHHVILSANFFRPSLKPAPPVLV